MEKKKLPEWAERAIRLIFVEIPDDDEVLRLKADCHEKWVSRWREIELDVLPAMKDWTDNEKILAFLIAMETGIWYQPNNVKHRLAALTQANEKLKGIAKSANALVAQIRALEIMEKDSENDLCVDFPTPWRLLEDLEPDCRDWSLDEPTIEDVLAFQDRLADPTIEDPFTEPDSIKLHGMPTSDMATLIEAFVNHIESSKTTIYSRLQSVFASKPRKDTGALRVLLGDLLGQSRFTKETQYYQAIATLATVALDHDPPWTDEAIGKQLKQIEIDSLTEE